jgi:PAS domain S-box-containing protein
VAVLSSEPTLNPSLPATTGPADAATHLLRLLEKQPSCVMRIGLDGLLLAVNDRSLNLLGADRHDQVLNTTLTDRLAPDHHELWREFAARVWSGGSGSVECDILDQAGSRRSLNLQGISLPDHPDGIRSVLVVARDVSSTRQLEQALQEHEATVRAAEQLRVELAAAKEHRERAETAVASRDADQQHFGLALDALREELERSLADGRRLADALAQQEIAQQKIEAVLTERETECRNLRSVLERYESDQQRLESELEQTLAEREQFEAMVKQREATRQRTLAEHASARMHFEHALQEATSRGQQLAQALTSQSNELQNMGKHLETLAKQIVKTEEKG